MIISQDADGLITIAQKTRLAASKLAVLSSELKNEALSSIASALESEKDEILPFNVIDCEAERA